ncbi:MAG: fimbrial protein [Parabacteroides gordonii]|nr:fimbrial protein [Parabacteroides gordonii]
MKLRNLFLGTLAVCIFASCSKDEDSIQGPVEPVDASLSFVASSVVKTKATEDADGSETKNKEDYVKDLYVYVFKVPADANGDASKMPLAGNGYVAAGEDGASVTTINHVIVKVTPKIEDPGAATDDDFIVVLVANPGKAFTPSTLADLRDATLTNSIETYKVGESYLPMVSKVLSISNLKPIVKNADGTTTHNENWVCEDNSVAYGTDATAPVGVEEIQLTRLVARVQVEKIINKIGDAYQGASFQLTNLSLVNVRPYATMASGKGGDTYEYVKGFESTNYEKYDEWIYPGFTGEALTGAYKSVLSSTYTLDLPAGETFFGGTSGNTQFLSYAFANPADASYKTALLITGNFKRNAATEAEVKNFRVILQDTSLGENAVQVVPNNVYKLIVTITGEGSSNEDKIESNAHVSVEIKVANWFVVGQTEIDVN